ncbi:multidrug transporter [Chitinophaga sp. SYP-B3965]|uniref:bestrophin family protein n=1 Tax=Chitinophaga sp. SYP-B3965 TaxID=2663120 RepID=UPI001299ED8E|nr:bestrophin family ion channel [Chitinophaga sp. SYP-B3965]MRG43665.1 multidrug transporter [Chitinophaga sp. SYP-B3965]
MNAGKKYTFREFVYWTRRHIYKLFFLALIPTVLYHLGLTFLSITWVPVALLGTAVSFIVGFKNNTSYSRAWEARTIYGSIVNNSRSFAVMIRDFLKDEAETKAIFYRHFAWLTALRFQLREPRPWENMTNPENVEYSSHYSLPERLTTMEDELKKYLPQEELHYILAKKNKATQIMALQSRHVNNLRLPEFQLLQLQTAITAFYDSQGRAERIKNFPYPRNYSSIASYLLYFFVLLVPFGLLNEFEKLGDGTLIEGYSIWLNVPFALLLSWVFVALDAVGESSVNPFEGNANDVPITNISRTIEIDMRDMLDEADLPSPTTAINNILM